MKLPPLDVLNGKLLLVWGERVLRTLSWVERAVVWGTAGASFDAVGRVYLPDALPVPAEWKSFDYDIHVKMTEDGPQLTRLHIQPVTKVG